MATIEEQTETGPITMTGREGWAEARAPIVGAGVRDIPGQVPPLATAGALLPPEEAPPVAPGEAPGAAPPAGGLNLVAGHDELQKLVDENYARQRAEAEVLRKQGEAKMAEARSIFGAAEGRYGEAAREEEALIERQTAQQMRPPKPPTIPPVPVQTMQPFGVGPEKETAMQALNRITGTLGLLAQMGMGMKSGYTRGAMAAFSGALDGWAKGQELAAQKQWREYLQHVQNLDKQWAMDRQHFEDDLRMNAADMERAKLKTAIRQTELGHAKTWVELTFRDYDQSMKMYELAGNQIQNLLKDSIAIGVSKMKYELDKSHQADVRQHQRQQEANWEAQRAAERARDAATIANQQAQRAHEARVATETERHHRRTEDIQAAKPGAAGGALQRQLDASAKSAGDALATLEGIIGDPKKAKSLLPYQGMGGQSLYDWKSSTKLLGKAPPEDVVDANNAIATIQNAILNIISGKQVAAHEEARLNRMLPKFSSRPEVFKREVQNVRPYIQYLMSLPNKGEVAPTPGAPAPGGAPQGGTPPPVPAASRKGEYANDGTAVWFSDGAKWNRVK